MVELNRGSCAVGFFDEIKVKKTVIPFEKNAQIVLFTDGVLEAIANDNLRLKRITYFYRKKMGRFRRRDRRVLQGRTKESAIR